MKRLTKAGDAVRDMSGKSEIARHHKLHAQVMGQRFLLVAVEMIWVKAKNSDCIQARR